jgi:hypothetical protein
MTGTNYELGRHADVCASTGAPLNPGDRYVACLVEREGEDGFDRVDYAADAWAQGNRPPRLFAFWTAEVPEPNKKPRLFIDDDALVSIFDQLEGATDPKRLAFRYVLALVLIRKRLIRQVGTRAAKGDEPAAMLFKRRGAATEAPPERVIDPALDEGGAPIVAEVTAQLGAILNPEG